LFLGASLAGQHRYEEAAPLIARSRQALLQRKDSIPAIGRYVLDQMEEPAR
jgi:hypothetical protein